MSRETGVKESEEHVRDGGGLKETVSRNIWDTARAASKTKVAQDIREKSSTLTSKNKLHQQKHDYHTIRYEYNKVVEGSEGKVGKGIGLQNTDNNIERSSSGPSRVTIMNPTCKSTLYRPENICQVVAPGSELGANKVIERGPTKATDSFWWKRKGAFRSDPSSDKNLKKLKKQAFTNQDDYVATFKAEKVEAENPTQKYSSEGSGPMVISKDAYSSGHNAECEDFLVDHAIDSNVLPTEDFDAQIVVPGSRSSRGKTVNFNSVDLQGSSTSRGKSTNHQAIVTPNKVKETLRLFRVVCRTLEEEKLEEDGIRCRRVDFQAAKILKDNLRHINIKKPIFGEIPGIEVNDQFLYRMELAIVGLHRPLRSGIDYVSQGGECLATSIVASGGYENDVSHPDTLVYVGQGGRATNKKKEPEDQVLKRGNLALKNSIRAENPVRVLRRTTKVINSFTDKNVEMYTYDGVYRVTKYWSELGSHKKSVYKFVLNRIPGQPKLVYKKIRQF